MVLTQLHSCCNKRATQIMSTILVLVFDSCLLKSDSVEALRKQGCTDANNGLFWLARSCPCRVAAWARGRARRLLSGRPLRLPAGKRNEAMSQAGDSDVCGDPRSNFQHTLVVRLAAPRVVKTADYLLDECEMAARIGGPAR